MSTEENVSSSSPSPNGPDGRDALGRFGKGNPGGPGNPYAKRVAAIRSALLDAVSEDDLRGIVNALVSKAKAGDVAAAKEVFNRLVGRPSAAIDPDRWRVDDLRMLSEAMKLAGLLVEVARCSPDAIGIGGWVEQSASILLTQMEALSEQMSALYEPAETEAEADTDNPPLPPETEPAQNQTL